MSAKGSIYIDLRIKDGVLPEKIEGLLWRGCGWTHIDGYLDGIELYYENEAAGWLTDELNAFRNDLDGAGLLGEGWTADIAYSCYEEDSRYEIGIESGEVVSCRQSADCMVDVPLLEGVPFDAKEPLLRIGKASAESWSNRGSGSATVLAKMIVAQDDLTTIQRFFARPDIVEAIVEYQGIFEDMCG